MRTIRVCVSLRFHVANFFSWMSVWVDFSENHCTRTDCFGRKGTFVSSFHTWRRLSNSNVACVMMKQDFETANGENKQLAPHLNNCLLTLKSNGGKYWIIRNTP